MTDQHNDKLRAEAERLHKEALYCANNSYVDEPTWKLDAINEIHAALLKARNDALEEACALTHGKLGCHDCYEAIRDLKGKQND